MESDEIVTLSAIEHFAFCPRQFGILFIEGLWEENAETVRGDLLHQKADDPFFNETRGVRRIVRRLPIFSDALGIQGIADCVEFEKDDSGAEIPELHGKYRVTAIEYKSGKPDGDGTPKECDALQLLAQMLCLNDMFQTEASGAIYYAKTKRRAPIALTEALTEKLFQTLAQIRSVLKVRRVPSVPKKQNCTRCSVADLCLAKADRKRGFFRMLDERIGGER